MEIVSQTENKTAENIKKLFEESGSIRIPAYQRAYSWENKQCTQFLEDLLEQKSKRYYLGQFLFEKDGETLFIIDGQQRSIAIAVGLTPISKSPTMGCRLWIDLMPPDRVTISSPKFDFYICSATKK